MIAFEALKESHGTFMSARCLGNVAWLTQICLQTKSSCSVSAYSARLAFSIGQNEEPDQRGPDVQALWPKKRRGQGWQEDTVGRGRGCRWNKVRYVG